MRRAEKVRLEVCVDSVESALAAERGGADRVELCASLDVGGTTPSAGLILEVRKRLSIDIHVMVRPRGGDFSYSQTEFETMLEDVAFCKRAKVAGVVLGIVKPNRALDRVRMRHLVKRAGRLHVTMHRAFDDVRNWKSAMDQLAAMGVQRILTSGGAASVERGRTRIRAMAVYARGRMQIVPGGGVTRANVPSLLSIPHIDSIHVLSAVTERGSAKAGSSYFVREQLVKHFNSLIQYR